MEPKTSMTLVSEFGGLSLDVLIEKERLQARIRELGAQITEDYRGKRPHLIGVLKGACVFLSRLMQHIDLPLTIDFIAVSSYGSEKKSSGEVQIIKDLSESLQHRDVIIVEDILDTGLTLNYLMTNFKSRGLASLAICALLDKPERRLQPVSAHYVGFSIPNEFVVGFGLDYGERYRNLPFIAVLKNAPAGAEDK